MKQLLPAQPAVLCVQQRPRHASGTGFQEQLASAEAALRRTMEEQLRLLRLQATAWQVLVKTIMFPYQCPAHHHHALVQPINSDVQKGKFDSVYKGFCILSNTDSEALVALKPKPAAVPGGPGQVQLPGDCRQGSQVHATSAPGVHKPAQGKARH